MFISMSFSLVIKDVELVTKYENKNGNFENLSYRQIESRKLRYLNEIFLKKPFH